MTAGRQASNKLILLNQTDDKTSKHDEIFLYEDGKKRQHDDAILSLVYIGHPACSSLQQPAAACNNLRRSATTCSVLGHGSRLYFTWREEEIKNKRKANQRKENSI